MNILYQDGLVRITDEELPLHRYYFPFATDKHVTWNEVVYVRVRLGGAWRLWGTGNLRTWFPQDYGRPGRDRIFIIHLRNRYSRIGFTVENSLPVLEILRQRGSLQVSTQV